MLCKGHKSTVLLYKVLPVISQSMKTVSINTESPAAFLLLILLREPALSCYSFKFQTCSFPHLWTVFITGLAQLPFLSSGICSLCSPTTLNELQHPSLCILIYPFPCFINVWALILTWHILFFHSVSLSTQMWSSWEQRCTVCSLLSLIAPRTTTAHSMWSINICWRNWYNNLK